MQLPTADRIDTIIDALTYPDDYSLNNKNIENLQAEIDGYSKLHPDNEVLSRLLLAQALIHYQNNNDAEAINFANAAINHGCNYEVAYNVLDTLSGNTEFKQSNTGTVYEDPIGGPFKYIVNFYANYFNFSGRARRAEFNYFIIYYILALFTLGFIDGLIGAVSNEPAGYGLFSTIFWLFNLIPYFALLTRRLHDINLSALAILFLLVPIAGLLLVILLIFKPGDSDSNKYGPNPKYYIE